MRSSTVLRNLGVPRETVTLAEAVAAAREQLVAAGIADAQAEARRLICRILEVDAAQLLAHPERQLDGAQSLRAQQAISLRAGGMPLGRIVGQRAFYGRPFSLSSETLEPRPDSEVLVDVALEICAASWGRDAPIRVLDFGVGSGCLLISVLAELPNARGVGVDISRDAVATAAHNARENGVQDRLRLQVGDGLDAVEGVFDLLISNPPYIPTCDIGGLEREVREHDPLQALDGGADGLHFYRMIGQHLLRLVPDGWLVAEIAAGDNARVCHEIDTCLAQNTQQKWRYWRDLAGRTRCVATKTRVNARPEKDLES